MTAPFLLLALSIAAVPDRFAPRGPGGGGALFSPTFSPDGNRLSVGCDMGGLYLSPDAGLSWSLVPHRQAMGGRSSSVRTSGAALLTVNQSGEAPRVSISRDGGATWSDLPSDPTGGGTYDFSVHPGDPRRILVTGWDSLWTTRDGGATWKGLQGEPDAGAGVLLGGAFWDGADVYLATNGGLFVSHDSGWTFSKATWTGIPTDHRLVGLSGGRKGATVRLLAVTAPLADVYNGIMVEDFHNTDPLLWTWTTGSTAWKASMGGVDAGDRLYLPGQAASSIDTLYAAGGQYQTDWPAIYRSVDGGGGWSPILSPTGNANVRTGWAGSGGDRDWSYGGMACGFGVAIGNGRELAYTDYGFVHVSDDAGTTWRQAYLDPRDQNPSNAPTPKGRSYRSAGLENTSAWDVCWADSLSVFAGFTDIRGIRSVDGGVSWGFGYSGVADNSVYKIARAADGTLYAATSSVHDLYQSTYLQDSRIDGGTGKVLVSRDKGATWTVLHDFGHPVVWIVLDPARPQEAWASVVHSTAGGVYHTANLGQGAAATWSALGAPPRTQGHPLSLSILPDGSLLSSWSGRRDAGGAFTASSGVFLLPSGSSTWQDLSDPGLRYWTKDVVVDPADATGHTWWAAVFSGWGGAPNGLGGLYRTVDAGAHWTRAWTSDRVESVGIPPAGTEIWASTETEGLWTAPDRTGTAPAFEHVDAYPFQHPARIVFNPRDPAETWITSFGNGLRVARRDGKPLDGIRHPLEVRRNAPEIGLRGPLLVVGGLVTGPHRIRVLHPDGREALSATVEADAAGNASIARPARGLWILELRGEARTRILIP
jgi:photosystem II stability/assembly factor-like uncharacterized protein